MTTAFWWIGLGTIAVQLAAAAIGTALARSGRRIRKMTMAYWMSGTSGIYAQFGAVAPEAAHPPISLRSF